MVYILLLLPLAMDVTCHKYMVFTVRNYSYYHTKNIYHKIYIIRYTLYTDILIEYIKDIETCLEICAIRFTRYFMEIIFPICSFLL